MAIFPLPCTDISIAEIGRAMTDMRTSEVDLWPGEEIRLSGGIPLYKPRAGLQTKPLTLRSLRMTGHRHLIFEDETGDPAFSVDVQPRGQNGVAVTSVVRPPLALMKLLRLTDAIATDEDFQLRIIEIPAAYSTCLWLHAKYNLFVLSRGKLGLRVFGADEYFDSINALIRRRHADWQALVDGKKGQRR